MRTMENVAKKKQKQKSFSHNQWAIIDNEVVTFFLLHFPFFSQSNWLFLSFRCICCDSSSIHHQVFDLPICANKWQPIIHSMTTLWLNVLSMLASGHWQLAMESDTAVQCAMQIANDYSAIYLNGKNDQWRFLLIDLEMISQIFVVFALNEMKSIFLLFFTSGRRWRLGPICAFQFSRNVSILKQNIGWWLSMWVFVIPFNLNWLLAPLQWMKWMRMSHNWVTSIFILWFIRHS